MKNERKTTQGPVNEKARTMKRLIDAVGTILIEEGHTKLSGARIASEAKTSRPLIYIYFGTPENLIGQYIRKHDFWTPETNKQIQLMLGKPWQKDGSQITRLLQMQLSAALGSRALQQILLWEISERNPVLRKIADEREKVGEQLFAFVEKDFENSGLDLRAILALIISGVYYSALHAVNNGSTFCGIDINDPEGKDRFDRAIMQVIDLCYEKIR